MAATYEEAASVLNPISHDLGTDHDSGAALVDNMLRDWALDISVSSQGFLSIQAGDATLASGTVTVNTGITVTTSSEVIPVGIGPLSGTTNLAGLYELKASRVAGGAGVGTIVLRAMGDDGAIDADAAGAIRYVIIEPPATDGLDEALTHWRAQVDKPVTITSAKLLPSGALTANGSNYATVTAEYDDGAGGADTVIATLVTDVAGGDWVAGTVKTMTLTGSAPVSVAAGKYLIIKIAKTGTGVLVPAFTISLRGKYT